jgi:hypothetical protein
MHELVGVDRRFLAWDSGQWGEFLKVKGSAVRKTRFWKKTRPRMIGEDRMIAEDQMIPKDQMIPEDQTQSGEK